MASLEALDKVHALAAERAANERIYPFMRERGQTFSDVLCFLMGNDRVTDDMVDKAIAFVHECDARIAEAKS